MTDNSISSRTYVLGHSTDELKRLTIQARLIAPITRGFLRNGGIATGMRVLDVGSGAGDVAFLAAELVGESGEVVGVDRAPDAITTATQRAAAAGFPNVSFLRGDPAQMQFDRPFDAIIGRYMLMFQPDPAATLRALATHVRPGGVVVFHEPDRAGIRSFPPVPLYDRCCKLVDETLRKSGADPRMGIKLYPTFVAAGLPAPRMRLESVIGGGADSLDQVHFEVDVVGSLIGEMERFGIATDAELHCQTLAERVLANVEASRSVIVGRAEVGAWCRT
jgi:SAM-dependent methyltransferase